MIQQHFQGQAISQLYSLLGSLSLLGNPLGSIARLGDGAKARAPSQPQCRRIGARR